MWFALEHDAQWVEINTEGIDHSGGMVLSCAGLEQG
jgi:hypothetical protein